MSKHQNHGKMKEWRRPEYKLIWVDGIYQEKVLVKQRPFVRRNSKSLYNKSTGWVPPLVFALMERADIKVVV